METWRRKKLIFPVFCLRRNPHRVFSVTNWSQNVCFITFFMTNFQHQHHGTNLMTRVWHKESQLEDQPSIKKRDFPHALTCFLASGTLTHADVQSQFKGKFFNVLHIKRQRKEEKKKKRLIFGVVTCSLFLRCGWFFYGMTSIEKRNVEIWKKKVREGRRAEDTRRRSETKSSDEGGG